MMFSQIVLLLPVLSIIVPSPSPLHLFASSAIAAATAADVASAATTAVAAVAACFRSSLRCFFPQCVCRRKGTVASNVCDQS